VFKKSLRLGAKLFTLFLKIPFNQQGIQKLLWRDQASLYQRRFLLEMCTLTLWRAGRLQKRVL
jgi:hypothetical protein